MLLQSESAEGENTMKNIFVSISIGELFDKIAILEIKSKKICDLNSIKNIEQEKNALMNICKENNIVLDDQFDELIKINEELWEILQLQRDKEKKKEFDSEFVQLSLDVYHKNDQRFEIKKKINKMQNSLLKEEKFYK